MFTPITNRLSGEAAARFAYSLKRGFQFSFDELFRAGIIQFFAGGKAGENYIVKAVRRKFCRNNIYDCKRIKFPAVPNDTAMLVYSEMRDILFQHLYNVKEDCPYYFEGPYEYKGVILKPGDVVIDAGANLGMFSAVASYKGCTVHAFEPVPQNLELLKQTAGMNKNIFVHPFALSDKGKELYFSIRAENNPGSFAGETTARSSDEVKANAISLDEFAELQQLKKIDFIKADIEGAERDLLKGASNVLKKFAPKLAICTYHRSDDPQVLESIIRNTNPAYTIVHRWKKLYAWVGTV